MSEYSVVGKSLPKIDAVAKATGEAKYASDLALPQMLSGKILWSPHPHARILNIDTSKAKRLAGVKAIITGENTLGIKHGCWRRYPALLDKLALAIDKVRYIGDEIAAVAAIDEDIAQEALELIKVEYEPLPAVFDIEEAMKENAPQIHDNIERNISITRHIEWGNVEEGFKNSAYIREDRFFLQPVVHACMETHSAVASFDGNGRLTVWTSTQCPYFIQCLLAMTLGMKEGNVRVIRTYVGGGFGGKNELYGDEFCAALLSKKAGRPVKIVYTREEEFTITSRRHPMIYELKTGVRRDGTLVAKECRAFLDGGGYNSMGATALYLTGFLQTFPYKLSNYKYDGYHVYTNKSPSSSMRGFGGPQAVFAGESQFDMIAEELGIDPIEMRLRNAMTPGYEIPGQFKLSSCGLSQCLEKVAESIKKRGKLPSGRGIGVASYGFESGGIFNWFDTPYAFSSALMRIDIDGTVNLFTQASDIGQGSDTVLCQIAAEELGVHVEDIRLIAGDTALAPVDIGAWGSRQTLMAGHAVKAAAADAKRQLLEVATVKLSPNIVYELECKDRRIYVKSRPERGIPFEEVVQAAIRSKDGEAIIGRGVYTPRGKGMVSPAYSFGAQVVEVEVDRETGQVKVLKAATAHDCGQPINPLAVEGQLEGSISMSMGYALSEELLTEAGKILNPNFADYKLVRAPDMPETETFAVETFEPEGPFGAKEAGEGLTLPTAAAIANAVYNAVGVRIKDLPITPQKVLKALREKEGKST